VAAQAADATKAWAVAAASRSRGLVIMVNGELLEQSLAELEGQIERHRNLLRTIVEERPHPVGTECLAANCRHRRLLTSVLLNAIGVIEDTRKAFKSRQLESLKKELARILQEELKAG
jgi:hypothetical protein